jgi:hypothetical protein
MANDFRRNLDQIQIALDESDLMIKKMATGLAQLEILFQAYQQSVKPRKKRVRKADR